MAEKIFYSMGEVAEMFDVNPSLIRYWQKHFTIIRPERNKKGNRLFSQEDVENLKLIYHFVRERGMTLDGAKKAMKQQRAEGGDVPREVELMERLQKIRALLVEVREDLKAGDGDIVTDMVEPAAVSRRSKPVVKIAEEADNVDKTETPVRKPRRKKEDDENRELFAFYEQTLF
jgi:DNA-binding transcriptional MerR regulator